MVDYQDSTHLNRWLFASTEQLEECRAKANHDARVWLANHSAKKKKKTKDNDTTTTDESASTSAPLPAFFAHGFSATKQQEETDHSNRNETMSVDYTTQGPWTNAKGHTFLTPSEEHTLISFYASNLATLIGPKAQVTRLLRESKVTATAALLYRRFFLSNSVHMFDPKAVLVAAAFLASKVEDAMADVRYLQEGTEKMQAPVSQQEIISAEISLLQGCHYDLLCFHPFKSVLALTEDLRTFLKSDKGQTLVERPISGQDLKPIYDKARWILEQVVIQGSFDLTLLYSPGPIGLASMIVAQEMVLKEHQQSKSSLPAPPRIDFMGYVQQRFPEHSTDTASQSLVHKDLPALCQQLQKLPSTSTNSQQQPSEETMAQLKVIHKKLKKVRYWGNSSNNSDGKKSGKKKKERSTTPTPNPAPSSFTDIKQEDNSNGRPPTPTMSNQSAESGVPPAKRVKMEG